MAEGLFKVVYQGSTAPAGGFNVVLPLTVDTVRHTVTGEVTITQATNPPLEITLPVSGTFTDMTVMNPTRTYHLIKLQSPAVPGRHVDLRMVAEPDWKSGDADVVLFLDTADGVKRFQVPMKAVD